MRRMYSENQIKNLIAESPEKVLEALQNQDLKVKTLEQSEANWSLPIESFGKLGSLDPTIAFARIQKVNQELEIVVSVSYANETESTVSAYATDSSVIELPSEIANKIYDCNGVKVSENTSSAIYIASSSAYASKTKSTDMSKLTGAPRLFLFNVNQNNKMNIIFASNSAIQVDAGGTTIIEGRIQLALI